MSDFTKPICFADLDDTIFNTKRKLVGEAVVVGALNKEGEPASFLNEKQANMFEWLNATTELIVNTARTSRNVKQLVLPFSSYMAVSHGALIFDKQGQVIPGYRELIIEQYNALDEGHKNLALALSELATDDAILRDFPDVTFRYREAKEYDITLIHTFKVTDNTKQASLVDLNNEIIKRGLVDPEVFYTHLNGNNLAYIPRFISKQNAVTYLLEHHLKDHEARFVLGLGDSDSDLPFMMECDFAAFPKVSQIASKYTTTE